MWMSSSISDLEGNKKGALRDVLDDCASDCNKSLKAYITWMKIMALVYLAIGVYKRVNGRNPKYLSHLFTFKECKYDYEMCFY